MADFDTDLQSIKHIVHRSRSEQEAKELFDSMHGFSITRQQADMILNDALRSKYPPVQAAVAVTERLAEKYCND